MRSRFEFYILIFIFSIYKFDSSFVFAQSKILTSKYKTVNLPYNLSRESGNWLVDIVDPKNSPLTDNEKKFLFGKPENADVYPTFTLPDKEGYSFYSVFEQSGDSSIHFMFVVSPNSKVIEKRKISWEVYNNEEQEPYIFSNTFINKDYSITTKSIKITKRDKENAPNMCNLETTELILGTNFKFNVNKIESENNLKCYMDYEKFILKLR